MKGFHTEKGGRECALVIGGSMAGLLAAAVLAKRFRRVVLLERDVLGTAIENRRGVPHGKHTHGFLAGGCRVLESLLPGILEELRAHGAIASDIVRDSRWFVEGGLHAQPESGLDGLLMSRPFLECHVRRRVLAIPNVEFRDGLSVTGLIASEDKARVVGVQSNSEEFRADLTVDTTGRASHAPRWLEALGYKAPEEERIGVSLAYTTRLFRRRSQHLGGDVAVIVPPTPSGKVGAAMLAQEGDRWSVTMVAQFGPAAPGDLNGFIEFARRLPCPDIYEAIRDAEPIGDALGMRYRESVRRRYEKLRRFPEGFLTMGDAICSFNPIYGQGMTAAAMEAAELDRSLAAGDTGLAKRFFTAAATAVDAPWSIAAGNDLRTPEATGRRTLAIRAINAYIAQVHKAAQTDPAVAIAFHRVANLLAPPPALMRPSVVARVLWNRLRALTTAGSSRARAPWSPAGSGRVPYSRAIQ